MNQLFTLTGATLDYPLPIVIFNILFAFLLGAVIGSVYKKNHRGLSYSSSFVFTLVLLTAAGSILMMIVGNSLARAFSLFGAFSIIRFRTAVKEAKDIAYVFISLIIGMAVGTNNYTIALISTALMISAIIIMTKRRFGEITTASHILSFHFPTSQATNSILKIINRYAKTHQLVNLTSFKKEKQLEFAYNIKFVAGVKVNKFIKELQKIKGVDNIHLISLAEDSIS